MEGMEYRYQDRVSRKREYGCTIQVLQASYVVLKFSNWLDVAIGRLEVVLARAIFIV